MNKKSFVAGIFTGVIISAFLSVVFVFGRIIYDKQAQEKQTKEIVNNVGESVQVAESQGVMSVLADEDLINKIIMLETIIDTYYIEDIDDEVLKEGICDGIMASIGDNYACYYTPEELLELTADTEGVYYGIGAVLQLDQTYNYPRITSIIRNSPSESSELRVDDYIVAVDGVDVFGMELSETVKLIKGPEGTTVTLDIVRKATEEQFTVELVRAKVETPTVNYEKLDDGLAYIQITEFDEVTVSQFEEALAQGQADGMEGLIIDLRGNPGGALDAVVDIAGMIVPDGIIVYTEDKYGNRKDYTSNDGKQLNIPIVVLVNGGSASASEIMAGAIKDYEMGYLLGTTTFGKGIVQRVIGLEDGSAVKLTVSHYYTPNGNDIHGVGIEPDEVLEFDVDSYLEDINNDNQKDRAVEILLEMIGN